MITNNLKHLRTLPASNQVPPTMSCSANRDNPLGLKAQLLRQLECPVCMETCALPIYMCPSGHGVCAACQPWLNECCFCRAPGKLTLRSVQLESIVALVQMPCANQSRGCALPRDAAPVMSLSDNALNAQLLRQLECPVCLDTCAAPIYICCNGHSVCAKCQAKLTECCVCRAPGRPTLRSVNLEGMAALVPVPCPNQPRGCAQAFNMSSMAEHLPECEHGFKCRMSPCKDWRGSVRDLKEHMENIHPEHVSAVPTSGTKYLKTRVFKKAPTRSMAFMCFDNLYFWDESSYNQTTRVFTTMVRLVSNDTAEASQYFYSLEFASKDPQSKMKVVYQGDVMTNTEVANEGKTDFVLPQRIIDSYPGEGVSYTRIIARK